MKRLNWFLRVALCTTYTLRCGAQLWHMLAQLNWGDALRFQYSVTLSFEETKVNFKETR